MNNKRPGEGLHILWEIISKGIEYRKKQLKFLKNQLSNWFFLPSCKKHGREHLFTHGYDRITECKKCWDERHNDNWQ